MTHSQLENLSPAAQAALSNPACPENSIFETLSHHAGPMLYESIVERVQARRPNFSRVAIAAALAVLISKQRVFLNQERTGFVAVRRNESKYLSRANAKSVTTPRA